MLHDTGNIDIIIYQGHRDYSRIDLQKYLHEILPDLSEIVVAIKVEIEKFHNTGLYMPLSYYIVIDHRLYRTAGDL